MAEHTLEIELTADFAPGYQCAGDWVSIEPEPHRIAISLHPGKHEFVSEPFAIGHLRKHAHRPLLARLAFTYEYDAELPSVTVCAANYVSAETLYLTTYPEGTEEFCHQRAHGHGNVHDDLLGNPHWYYLDPLMPGLSGFLRSVATRTIDALIAVLKETDGLSVGVKQPAPMLPPEVSRDLMRVYRDGEFVESYDPDKEYGSDCSFITVESTFAGTFNFAVNAAFANVRGSTRDPKINNQSWIALWTATFHNAGPQGICASTTFPAGFACGGNIVGGHIVSGTQWRSPPQGSTVYIIPICHNHNMRYDTNGVSLGMKAINWQQSVQLNYW